MGAEVVDFYQDFISFSSESIEKSLIKQVLFILRNLVAQK